MNDDGPEVLPPPTNPMAVARALLPDWQHHGHLTLRHWRGQWTTWAGHSWIDIDDRAVRARLYARTEQAVFTTRTKDGAPEHKPWSPTRPKIADLTEALAAILHTSTHINPPIWLAAGTPPDGPIVSCANGLLHVTDRSMHDHHPAFFNRVAIPFDYAPAAPEPARWLDFLDQLWPHDPDAIDTLQEWFGYIVSGRTDLQKILLIVGPPRSGKGTIARILTALTGKANTAAPTLASLAANFGLNPLLNKSLALVSDARLGGPAIHEVVERLLSISGEDILTVDRKYRDPWTGKLPTRFMILSNELPRFGDASGAIATRFIVLTLAKSFLGEENTALTRQLLAELPRLLRRRRRRPRGTDLPDLGVRP